MRKIILSIFFLLTINSVLALDCQYTENEEYDQLVTRLYNNETLYGDSLTFSDFQGGYGNIAGNCRYSFKISSPYQGDFLINIKYYVYMPPLAYFHGEIKEEHSEQIKIGGYSSYKVSGEWGGIGSCSVLEDEISYNVLAPSGLFTKKEYIKNTREVCKKCPPPADFICLNDGVPSDSDEKCGSGRRTAAGICSTKGGIKNDSLCSIELGENCLNSLSDCACEAYEICEKGSCVADPNTLTPPMDTIYCSVVNAFKKTNAKLQGEPCDCDFECVEHYKNCDLKQCQPEPNNPPESQKYCPEINYFRPINALDLGASCDCDFECTSGVCYNKVCQKLMTPKLTCPSGTSVKKGNALSCNLVARNTLLNKDVKATFVLDAGNGLGFSESFGCQNIKGSQCMGTHTIAELSNEGVEVKLTCTSGGKSKVGGTVVFPYKSASITEIVDDLEVYCYFCGDKVIDVDETRENCCIDTGVSNYSFFNICNEECSDNKLSCIFNWHLFFLLALTLLIVGLYSWKFVSNVLNQRRQQELVNHIQKLNLEITKKEKEVEIDRRLIHKFETEKTMSAELEVLKNRINDSIKTVSELRKNEHLEKEKLQKERLNPFTNKQGHPVIINDEGYEQFAKNLKYPDQPGELFHRWYAKKEIYYKNRQKYPLPWNEYDVHHKDGNKRNNDLSNLEILSKEEHKRKHNL